MDSLKKWVNMFMSFSILLSFLTIILFYSRLRFVLVCTSTSLVLITIALKLIANTIQEEINNLSMKITLLETTLMHRYDK